ncbi:hypothetical protein Y013_26000 (plasmid) [Rhodococcus pyridinivorans SB3094]|uniref:Uncharacterized protein n=1 Tax=Rhodococcus pyridinivorans SB3094 TaxID=1435356 RepID=V9XLL2_9NOCA|nr:hypothetical protein Y013_26000 [Rhodococcus pyridinivorans SB3094]
MLLRLVRMLLTDDQDRVAAGVELPRLLFR